jgi:hypothetical protein
MVNQPLVKKRNVSLQREVPLLALKHSGNGSKVINKKLLPCQWETLIFVMNSPLL